jgi:hypothetical protein
MTLVMLAMFSVTLLGCGDDNPTDPDTVIPAEDPVDPEGAWIFEITVTDATQDCDGEEGEFSDNEITITITGGTAPSFNVSASGFLGLAGNVLDGTFNEDTNRLVISGDYPEDGGTTSASHDLVATTDNLMLGTETWGWTDGPNTSCPNSKSDVTAKRVIP